LSSLAAIFGNSPDKSQDSEKLLDLYWNRAALKKKFAGMRKEQFRLQDKIKTKCYRFSQQVGQLKGGKCPLPGHIRCSSRGHCATISQALS